MPAHLRRLTGNPIVHGKWETLEATLTKRDTTTIYLSSQDVRLIHDYAEKFFDKAYIDSRASQWASSKGKNKANPNEVGIRGEWAGFQHFRNQDKESSLSPQILEFLADRPWKMGDMGDCIIIGRKPKIFDFKTRSRNADVERLLGDDSFCAEMDAKFADKRYGYLQAFIFCVNNQINNDIHLMGWLPRETFMENAELIKKGTPIPHSMYSYSCDTLAIPYRRLRSLTQIEGLSYRPLSEQMSRQMKVDWEQVKYDTKQFMVRLPRVLTTNR